MTRHYPDLGSASDWLKQISQAAQPIRSTTQIWVATRQQQQQQQQHCLYFTPNIQEIKIYNNSTDNDRGAGCPK